MVSLLLLLSPKLASLDVTAVVVLIVLPLLDLGGNGEVFCCWCVGVWSQLGEMGTESPRDKVEKRRKKRKK